MTIKTQNYKDFSKRIDTLAYKKRFPLRVMFELTYRCNFRCIHCYNTDEQKKTKSDDELNSKDVFSILEQLKDLGCFYLGFTGGEIFLRKDIFEILWYAKRLGFEIILLTNASLIDERIVNELQSLMPNKVDITVHAINKEIFDKITQVSNSADKVFKAIGLLYKRNIPLSLKSCGMQDNKDEIIKISKFSRRLNVIYRFGADLTPRHDHSRIPLDYSISPKEEYFLRKACYPEMFAKYDAKKRLRKKDDSQRNLKRLFNCSAGYTDLAISPFGELKICVEIDYPKYKILEGSLFRGWQQIKDFMDNISPPNDWACRTCNLIKYCPWCPAKGYLEDGNFFTCNPYSKEQAEFYKQVYEQDEW